MNLTVTVLNILGGCCLAKSPSLYSLLPDLLPCAVVYYLSRDIFLDSILDVFFSPRLFSSRRHESSFESSFSNERSVAICLCVKERERRHGEITNVSSVQPLFISAPARQPGKG